MRKTPESIPVEVVGELANEHLAILAELLVDLSEGSDQ
jgi:hypothetical protein